MHCSPSFLFLHVTLKCIWCTLVAALIILYLRSAKGEIVITEAVFEIIQSLMSTWVYSSLFSLIFPQMEAPEEIQVAPTTAHLFTSQKSQGILIVWGSHLTCFNVLLVVRQLLHFTQRCISFSSGYLSMCIYYATLHSSHPCLPPFLCPPNEVNNIELSVKIIHHTVNRIKKYWNYSILLSVALLWWFSLGMWINRDKMT